jgi:hypothetical protein
MVAEERYVFVDSPIEDSQCFEIGGNYALFGCTAISELEVPTDGLTLFSARLSAFELAVASSVEHFQLKHYLVEHISKL